MHFHVFIHGLGAGESMPRAEPPRSKISPFSPTADYKRDTSESEEEKSESDEAARKAAERETSEKKGAARSSGRSRRSRKRSRNAKRGRDPSYSHNKRRHRRGEGHRRRRRERKSVDKGRRSESPAAKANKLDKSAAERPQSPTWDPDKARTRPCSHCGMEITTQQSGRLQHQWASRTCLTWQFWNQLDAEIKSKNAKAGWEKAKKAAFSLYERRRMQAAPYQATGELAPPPPLLLRSRASVARTAADALEEMEEIPVEPEPVPRPTRQTRARSAAPSMAPSGEVPGTPAAATGSAAALPSGHGPVATQPAAPGGQKQQIVININST